jgi:hypothetical protein
VSAHSAAPVAAPVTGADVAASPHTVRSHTTATPIFAAAALAALAVALRAPATTTVLGLACFGILHNVLELRYVAGRFAGILAGPFLKLLLIFVTGIAICRLIPADDFSRRAEILLAYALISAACIRALRDRRIALAVAALVIATAACASLAYPSYHFVVLAHLHNVVPLFFLWEWSRTLPDRHRKAFRAMQLTWVVAIPALLLSGFFDTWLHGGPVALGAFGGSTGPHSAHTMAAVYTPPALLDSAMALRFLAVFAFLQTMHYVVWVWFMPRHAPESSAAFQKRIPGLTGRTVWILGLVGTALLALVFATDYASGKTVYSSIATFHAYLEFPVLLALILGFRPVPAKETA